RRGGDLGAAEDRRGAEARQDPVYARPAHAVSCRQALKTPSDLMRSARMKVTNAIAQILKKEGIEFLIGYPVNPIIEGAAEADIGKIMVVQLGMSRDIS